MIMKFEVQYSEWLRAFQNIYFKKKLCLILSFETYAYLENILKYS